MNTTIVCVLSQLALEIQYFNFIFYLFRIRQLHHANTKNTKLQKTGPPYNENSVSSHHSQAQAHNLEPRFTKNLKSDRNRKPISGAKMRFTKIHKLMITSVFERK